MSIDFKDLYIDKDEVLRYLEYSGQQISENLENTIKECINLTKNKINPRYILRVYPIIRSIKMSVKDEEEYRVEIKGTNLEIKSKDIYNLLDGCTECVLMATTIGIDIERDIKKYSYSDLTKSIIIDSCATVAIEEVCDSIQTHLEKDLLKQDKYITRRYSPGYGDFLIEMNTEIINILGVQNRIGLTITESKIMIPRKSVISIIGISQKQKCGTKKSCIDCKNNNCKYRRKVDACGN